MLLTTLRGHGLGGWNGSENGRENIYVGLVVQLKQRDTDHVCDWTSVTEPREINTFLQTKRMLHS